MTQAKPRTRLSLPRALILGLILTGSTFAAPARASQSQLTLIWPATDPKETVEDRKLALLAAALQVRLERSAPTSSLRFESAGREGVVVVRSCVDRDQAEAAASAIKDIASELAFTGIAEPEFRRALELVSSGSLELAPCSRPELQALATEYLGNGVRSVIESSRKRRGARDSR